MTSAGGGEGAAPDPPVRPPTLTLFCGLPGSGKTTLARALERRGRGVRLCTDEWQASLGVEHADGAFHERLQARLWIAATDLLRHGVDVIWEDGLWRRSEREERIRVARALHARIELHVFVVPPEVLRSRLQHRRDEADPGAYPMTAAELAHAERLFQPPTGAELAMVDAFWVRSGGLADGAGPGGPLDPPA